LILVSLTAFQEQLENEIDAYDLLKELNSPILKERSIDELPELLIEFKILSGLTQKEFSRRIGMKEQQLQRYEAENFNSISFKNLLKILHAVGLEITVKGTVSGGK
jgi:DNA-binding Xre family transcriptional regulator